MRSLLLAGLILAVVAPIRSQTANAWSLRVPAQPWLRPTARTDGGMAWDAAAGRTRLFGGRLAALLPDSWVWDGNGWTQLFQVAPSPRAGHAMAFDPNRNVVLLFGGTDNPGYGSGLQDDTWVLLGTGWQRLQPPSVPPARTGHVLASDALRGRVVLFGGWNGVPLADTWEWHGGDWLPRISQQHPPARHQHAMTFDGNRGLTVLFGGQGSTALLADTWEWDGSTWQQRQPTASPPPMSRHAMASLDNVGRVVLYAGSTTWEWDGVTWQQATAVGPGFRQGHSLTYDPIRGRCLLFGGDQTGSRADELWEYGPPSRSAVVRVIGASCSLPGLGLTAALGARPVPGTTWHADAGPAWYGGPVLMTFGASASLYGPFLLPLPLDTFGLRGCRLYHDLAFGTQPCVSMGPLFRHSIPIPNLPALIGTRFYEQAWLPAPGVNPAGFVVTNALELTIGL